MAGALTALICFWGTTAFAAPKPGDNPKLDRKLNDRANSGAAGTSRVIVVLNPNADASGDYKKAGATKGRHFGSINSDVISLPSAMLKKLADSPAIASMHWDRPVQGSMNIASITTGARTANLLGYNGAGVGVAVIDSGVAGWHDDLTYQGFSSAVKVVNGQRVVKFVDFVNGLTTPYDDYGHGTHVTGIIAGNGYDSFGARAGIAPSADIISLKALDANGGGYISNVIAALDWVAQNHTAYNIRVVNVSIGAAVTESAWADPLDLAAKSVVDAGVVVVAAAGNIGKNPTTGQIQYGGITAPGNAPWVLTVGADSDMGTIARSDDVMANYSSRGPTAIDYGAKPDVVAPGTGVVSLAAPGSTLFKNDPQYLLSGLRLTANKPYLSLTGTSMAAPMVAGTVALMIQANPALTPNLAKAIIEYTAQNYGYDALTQGAGFLNSFGAVQLASYLAHPRAGSYYPSSPNWSKTIIWGNNKLAGGVIKPAGNAYALNIVWGTAATQALNIVWGTQCGTSECDNIVWGTDSLLDGDNIVWGTVSGEGDNIVWGTTVQALNIVWGTSLQALNIVWGTSGETDNIVWGTSDIEDSAVPVGDDMTDYSSVDFDSLFGGTPTLTTTATTIVGGAL